MSRQVGKEKGAKKQMSGSATPLKTKTCCCLAASQKGAKKID
jgi:hypothetical protein